MKIPRKSALFVAVVLKGMKIEVVSLRYKDRRHGSSEFRLLLAEVRPRRDDNY